MSYDLNILCINQNDASKSLPFTSSIELRSEFDSPYSGRYYSIWPFMCSLKGVWYYLGKDDDDWFNTMSIVTADFDKTMEGVLSPYWGFDEDIISNFIPMIVYNEHKRDFINIIQFLIQQSPNKTIMFLARFQGGEKEIIQGVLEQEEFIGLLSQSKILFNVCYIVNGNDNG